MKTNAINIKDVNFDYNGTPVLRKITLQVRDNDFLAIVGPNGGGKTTLIKLMLGLLKPKSGTIQVLGDKPAKTSQKIGYVPQHTNIRPGFPVTALDTVLMGLSGPKTRGWKFSPAQTKSARHSLARVRLSGLESKQIGNLSGGEKQRVLIARALVSSPKMLILDEPTANIDPKAKFCLYEMLAELTGSATIIVVSHDLSILASRVNSVACINQELSCNNAPQMTEPMLTLLYGDHDHACDITQFMRSVPHHIELSKKEQA